MGQPLQFEPEMIVGDAGPGAGTPDARSPAPTSCAALPGDLRRVRVLDAVADFATAAVLADSAAPSWAYSTLATVVHFCGGFLAPAAPSARKRICVAIVFLHTAVDLKV